LFENLCGKCDHKNCCTDSAVPLVFANDLKKIKKSDSKYKQHLTTVKINGKNIDAIKKKNGSKECIFWNNEIGGCSIYESRPMDCKLYPFDILFIENKYCWIVYSCNVNNY